MRRLAWFTTLLLIILLSEVGCQPQQSTPAPEMIPGFENVPLHPQSSNPRRVADRVEFEVSSTPEQVIQYYEDQLSRNGWQQMDRFGWAFIYKKGQSQILLVVTSLDSTVRVSIQNYPPE